MHVTSRRDHQTKILSGQIVILTGHYYEPCTTIPQQVRN